MYLSADTMAFMLGLDLPPEKLVELVKRLDADAGSMQPPTKTRTNGAERQARYRERHASQSVTGNDESNASPPPPPCPPPLLPEPLNPSPYNPPPTKTDQRSESSDLFGGHGNPIVVATKPTTDRFEEGWKAYPTAGRKRSGRVAAEPLWKKSAKAAGGEQALIDAITRYAASADATNEGGKYVPALDRWLKTGRFSFWVENGDRPDPSTDPPRIEFV